MDIESKKRDYYKDLYFIEYVVNNHYEHEHIGTHVTDCDCRYFSTLLNDNGASHLTVCPECHVDDFIHVENCSLGDECRIMLEKWLSEEIKESRKPSGGIIVDKSKATIEEPPLNPHLPNRIK